MIADFFRIAGFVTAGTIYVFCLVAMVVRASNGGGVKYVIAAAITLILGITTEIMFLNNLMK